MNDLPRLKLVEIIAHYGRSVCEDSRRCKGLLNDLCPGYRKEVYVLVSAIEEQVVAELLVSSDSLPWEVVTARLVQRLIEARALSEDAARWSVEAWGLALGVKANPSSSTRETLRRSPVSPINGADHSEFTFQISTSNKSSRSADLPKLVDRDSTDRTATHGRGVVSRGVKIRCPKCSESFRTPDVNWLSIKCIKCGTVLVPKPTGEKRAGADISRSAPEVRDRDLRSEYHDNDFDLDIDLDLDLDLYDRRVPDIDLDLEKEARKAVRLPAVSLTAIGTMNSLGNFFMWICGTGVEFDKGFSDPSANFLLVYLLVASIASAWVVYASVQMMRLKKFRSSILASFLAILGAGLCCIPSVPVGLWSLFVLMKPGVRDAFRQVDHIGFPRGT